MKHPILAILGILFVALQTTSVQATSAVLPESRPMNCAMSQAEVTTSGAAGVTIGRTTIYAGYSQDGTNHNPVVVRFDDGEQTWCRADYEITPANSRGYGIYWDGNQLYAVFSVAAPRGSGERDFRRFTVEGWLPEYGQTDAEAAVIARINPLDGEISAATFHSSVQTNDTPNGLTVTELLITDEGNVVVRADSLSFPREIDRSRMVCTGGPYRYTIEFSPDLTQAIGAISTGCTAVSPMPSVARVPGQVDVTDPAPDSFFAEGNVTFRWSIVAEAVWYRLYIYEPAGNVIDEWFRAADVCEMTTCTTELTLESQGAHHWYIAAWGADGHGPWTTGSVFYVGRRPPTVATTIGPRGIIPDPMAALQWREQPDALWYRVYILGPGDFFYDGWRRKADICEEGVCSLPFTDLFLTNGDYSWWVMAWGEGGFSRWTPDAVQFSLDAPAPGIITPLAPSNEDVVSAERVSFQWRPDIGTMWYRLYIGEQGSLLPIYDEWHDAILICADSVCNVDLALPPGDYSWYLNAWGPAGFGQWNEQIDFTAHLDAPTPSPVSSTQQPEP